MHTCVRTDACMRPYRHTYASYYVQTTSEADSAGKRPRERESFCTRTQTHNCTHACMSVMLTTNEADSGVGCGRHTLCLLCWDKSTNTDACRRLALWQAFIDAAEQAQDAQSALLLAELQVRVCVGGGMHMPPHVCTCIQMWHTVGAAPCRNCRLHFKYAA
jgi:hypothetical protein